MTGREKRLEEALEVATEHLRQLCTFGGGNSEGNWIAQKAYREVQAILNPPPAEETVEVVRWVCAECDEVYDMDPVAHGWMKCGAKLDEHGGVCRHNQYIKLTGTITRPVPRPVERSVTAENVQMDMSINGMALWPHGAKLKGDVGPYGWDGLAGKRGTLTFTWTETPKGE